MALNAARKHELAVALEKQKCNEVINLNKMHVENKNRYRNLERCIHIERREREMDNEILKTKEKAALIERKIEKEEALASELDKIKREEFKQLKMRQCLRESSHELRELESKLRAAYVSKELAAQRAEKEAKKLEEKVREKEAYAVLCTAQLTRQEMDKKKKVETMHKKHKYRTELQDQMIINEKRKRYLYEEFLLEKKMIDEIVQRIHAEDEREIEEKMCRRKRTRQQMDAFKKAQTIWREKERDEMEAENRRIQEFLMSKAVEMQNREQKNDKQNAYKAKIAEQIGMSVYDIECKRREREEIMQELYQEEQKQASDRKHHAEIEKEIRQRVETRDQLVLQMAERKARLQQQAAEDARYKDELIAKMVEDDKLDQLSVQKKRMKMQQLRRDVEQMMTDRRQKRAEEMMMMTKVKEADEVEATERRKRIEEERLRMLREHAVHLIGYLPKGVLRADDLPLLGGDILPKAKE